MKKFFLALGILVVVAVGAVLVGPNFINWNKYKDDIAAQAEAFTGRKMTIGGNIHISLLPTPVLIAQKVQLANLKGASTPDMVRLKSLEIRISLRSLLVGDVQVETVHLVDPVIELEVLADGRRNWDFSSNSGAKPVPEGAAKAARDGSAGGGSKTRDTAIRLDNFVVENGTVIYRDAKSGTVERIDRLNAHFAAASLIGPFDSAGDLVFRGMPLVYDLSVGQIIQGRTVPIDVTLGTQTGGAKIEADGTLVNLDEAPKFKGKLKATGDNLATAIQAVDRGDLPGFLAQKFSVESPVVADESTIDLSALSLQLGDTQANGSLRVTQGDIVNVAAKLHATRIDLDSWLAMKPAVAPAAPAGKAAVVVPDGGHGRPAADPAPANGGLPGVPADLAGTLAVTADIMTYNGGVIHQAQANLELSQGEVTVHQLSAQFPGSSEVAVFGFVTAAKGAPRFDGQIESSVADLRGVFRWLNVPLPPVASDRLRQLTLRGKLIATPEQVELAGAEVKIDSSVITGGIAVAMQKRPSFGLSMAVDRVNIDAYMPTAPAGAEPSAAPGGTGGAAVSGQGQAVSAGRPWAALADFDANIKVRVKSAVYQDIPLRNLVLDATLYDGALNLRRLSVDDMAGATANVSGKVNDLGGIPAFAGLKAEAGAKSLERLMRLRDIKPPFDVARMGAVAVSATLNGPFDAPKVAATLRGAGGEASFDGSLAPASPDAMIDGKLTAKHADLVKLLRVFKIRYRPAGRLAGFDLTGAVKAGPAAVSVTGLDGKFADVPVKGDISVALTGAKPKVTAKLTTGDLAIDRFLPAEKTAAIDPLFEPGAGRIVPASWHGAGLPVRPLVWRIAAKTAERWSKDPLDLTALQAIDADIDLTSSALSYNDLRLNDAKVTAKLADGTLTADRIAGTLYGGSLDGSGKLATAGTPRLDGTITVKNADLRGLIGSTGKALDGGRVDLQSTVSAAGRSMADLVATLGGKGNMAINGVQVKGSGGGPFALLGALGKLGGAADKATVADVTGSFVIDKGIARSQDLKLTSGIGVGNATGTVDLPNWTIDVDGTIQLADTVLTAILTSKVKGLKDAKPVPFSVKGSLDAPNVKVDTASLPSGGITLPGLGEALKGKVNEKTAVGKALRELFPDQQKSGTSGTAAPVAPPAPTTSNEPPPPPPPATPGQTTTPQKVKPEDILKDVLKGLSR